jgi:anthraniloyl-CoA monooxygenase
MRDAWPATKPISVRISASDWAEGGITGDDAVEIARAFARAGCDLIDVSSGQTVTQSRPVYGRMFQTPLSEQIRNEARMATMCVGNITTADQMNSILAAGRADLVALGRPHLADPYFTLHAAAQYGVTLPAGPPQYEPGRAQLMRTAEQARAELVELKLKAKPKQHAPAMARAAE